MYKWLLIRLQPIGESVQEIYKSQVASEKALKDVIEWLEIGQCKRLQALKDRLYMRLNNNRLTALVLQDRFVTGSYKLIVLSKGGIYRE